MKIFSTIFFAFILISTFSAPQTAHAGFIADAISSVVDAVGAAVGNAVSVVSGVVQGSLDLVTGGSFSDGYQQGFCNLGSSEGILSGGDCNSGSTTTSIPSGCGTGTLNDTCPPPTPSGCGSGTLNDTCPPPPPICTVNVGSGSCTDLGPGYTGSYSFSYDSCTGNWIDILSNNCVAPAVVIPSGCGAGTLNDTCYTPTCANGGIDGATCCGNGYSNYPTCWVVPVTPTACVSDGCAEVNVNLYCTSESCTGNCPPYPYKQGTKTSGISASGASCAPAVTPTCANGGIDGATCCGNGYSNYPICWTAATPTCANGGIDGATCCGNGYSNYPTCWVVPVSPIVPVAPTPLPSGCGSGTLNNTCCASNEGAGCSSGGNFCGQTNSGSIECSGACSASTPSDSLCPPPTVSISASPNRVRAGNSSTISWSESYARSCTITKNGSVKWTSLSSTGTPDTITTQSIYQISCTGPGGTASASVPATVNVVPTFQEF